MSLGGVDHDHNNPVEFSGPTPPKLEVPEKSTLYMRIGRLSENDPEIKVLRTHNKSCKSSAKTIAEFMKSDYGQQHIQKLESSRQERIYNHLYNKAYHRGISGKINDLSNRLLGKTSNKEYYEQALQSFNRAAFSPSPNTAEVREKAFQKVESHRQNESPSPRTLQESIDNARRYVNANKEALMLRAAQSNEGTVHIKKGESGLDSGITVTRDGAAFMHVKGAFARGGQQAVKFGLDIFANEVVVRGVSLPQHRAEVNPAIHKIAGGNNVIDVHAIVSNDGQTAVISQYCSGGDLKGRLPLAVSTQTPSYYFTAFPNQEVALDAILGNNPREEQVSIIKNLARQAIEDGKRHSQLQNKMISGEIQPRELEQLQAIESNPLFGMMQLSSSTPLKEGLSIDANEISELILDAHAGIEREVILNQGSLSNAEVAVAVFQMTNALVSIHESGCLHGDVKPENHLLNSRGEVILGDLNSAIVIEHELQEIRDPESQQILSPKGDLSFSGTEAYKPPELAQPKQKQLELYNPDTNPAAVETVKKQDVYALGASIFEMQTGKRSPAADPEQIGLETYNNDTFGYSVDDRLARLPADRGSIDPEPPQGTLAHIAWRARDPNPLSRPSSQEICQEVAALMMNIPEAAASYISMKRDSLSQINQQAHSYAQGAPSSAAIAKTMQKLSQLDRELETVLSTSPERTDQEKANKSTLRLMQKQAQHLMQSLSGVQVRETAPKRRIKDAARQANAINAAALQIDDPKTPTERIRNILLDPNTSHEEKGLLVFREHQRHIAEQSQRDAKEVLGGADGVDTFFKAVLDEILSDQRTVPLMKKLSQQRELDLDLMAQLPVYDEITSTMQTEARTSLDQERRTLSLEEMSPRSYELKMAQIEDLDVSILVQRQYESLLSSLRHHERLNPNTNSLTA